MGHRMWSLTVGDLRRVIEGLPDDTPVIRPGRGDIPMSTAMVGEAWHVSDLRPECAWFVRPPDLDDGPLDKHPRSLHTVLLLD